MGSLLSFDDAVRKKVFRAVCVGIIDSNSEAKSVGQRYATLAMKDPMAAIEQLPRVIREMRSVNPIPTYESFAGGPNPEWFSPLLNVVGAVYPTLRKDDRRIALTKCLNFLDGLRCDYSENQVRFVDDPWLVSDIAINRPPYWPGYKEYALMMGDIKSWTEFENKSKKVDSAFRLAIAICRQEYSSLPIRRKFFEEYPVLMDRTLDGIATFVDHRARFDVGKGKDIGRAWQDLNPHQSVSIFANSSQKLSVADRTIRVMLHAHELKLE